VSTEETSAGSETFGVSGSAVIEEGEAFGTPMSISGPLAGTITCQGETNFQIDWSGLLNGESVFGLPAAYTGWAHDTEEGGSFSSLGGGTYFGEIHGAQQSAGPQPGLVVIDNPSDTLTSSVSTAPVNPSQLPPGLVAPVGAVAFSVDELSAFGTIDVTLVLPSGSEPTEAYKSVGETYELYPADKTKFHGNEITVELTDNELPWDENLELGVITDPIIPVHPQLAPGAAPTIKKVSPKKGPTDRDMTVSIAGTGFTGTTQVSFGATRARRFPVNSPGSITAVALEATPGTVEVVVTTPNGASGVAAKDHYTFVAPKKRKGR
jgi:hypothetical protein